MELKIQGLSDVFEIIGSLYKGVKAAAKIPEETKKEMREALADTAELIDETLTIVKQHLSTIAGELKFGDESKARQMIFDLGNFQQWEQRYRKFELCDTLREAAFSLERKGLYKLKTKVSYGKPEDLQKLVWDFLGGESNAANSVGEMLMNLSHKSGFNAAEKDGMIGAIESARDEVAEWRQKFVDLEKNIRAAIG